MAPALSDELKKIRDRIDALDDRLVELLNQRAALAQDIGRAKRGAVYRPEREAQVLRRLMACNRGPLSSQALSRLYTEIMSACRALEDGIRVAYLGPQGTFSEEAALKQFGGDFQRLPCASIDEVFRAVETGRAGYGVVPIENSTEGSIGRTHDLLLATPLRICGEILLPVHQCLMSRSGRLKQIKKVLSHSQSLAQCHEWLYRYLPGAKQIPEVSNSEAARLAARDAAAAAIASRTAAEVHGLKVIAANIEDEPQNTTRFLAIATHDAGRSGRDKTSLVLSARNAPGAVHALLTPLARHGVSMTRFESRPARTGRWEYVFYVDVEGHQQDPRVAQALKSLGAKAAFLKNLGSYPAGAV
ncbi:MAG TPA: prephenate dehydratase [Burkholderiales bacterium]|nr:prephenate dehydratase [Burkholderiales bacterium]